MMIKEEKMHSIFDNKKKYLMISEDELKQMHDYVFGGLHGFDFVTAKGLFDKVASRQGIYDVKSWQLVCKYCPLEVRCEKSTDDTWKCELFQRMSVRDYALHAQDEVQFQRMRLAKFFTEGECDGLCDRCILCGNDGVCVASTSLKFYYFTKKDKKSSNYVDEHPDIIEWT